MPSVWRVFKIRSLRSAPEPPVEFDCHGRKEMPLFHSIEQGFAEGMASDISLGGLILTAAIR